ncbi:MAG: Tetratricopeptide repeat, partial [Cyanobacteria bacterium RYN_339]|nr:Tetratricopeptide repeat [Cyanobacteria bacterium RYN_339]
LALGGARVADRARYVRLLDRAARGRDALAVFAAQPLRELDADTLVEGAALARGQGDRPLEERALRALIARRGTDLPARLRLIELLDRRGARADADHQASAALGLAADDAGVLLALASRAFYGGRPADALVERLARLQDPPAGVHALLADAFEAKAPARAATALDAWHHITGGTAASWLRRGDLAQRLAEPARRAWERALELAPTPSETRAWALDRLGRHDEALTAWKLLAHSAPTALAPALALGRHHVDRGELAAAAPFLTRALAVAPQDPAVRRLQADWLARGKRPAEALAVARTLPRDAGVLAFEAQRHHELGELRQAARTADAAVALDPALAAGLRPLRQDAATRPRAFARLEHTGGMDRQDLGLDTRMLWGERTQASVGIHHQTWGGTATEEVDLGLRQPVAGAVLEGEVGLVSQGQGLQTPVGRAGVRWPNGGVSVGEARWADAPAAVALGGRERSLQADAQWQPMRNVDLSAGVGVGRLALGAAEVGTSTSARAEVAVRPTSAPVTLAYQYGHRGWGTAAPLVGLPATADVHGVLARYDATMGPLRLTLAPGYALDAASGVAAPTLNGSLAYAPMPETEVTLTGAFAGRSFDLGLADAYRLVELAARMSF